MPIPIGQTGEHGFDRALDQRSDRQRPITSFLGADHGRMHAWLEAALDAEGHVALEPFERFRAAILWHIAVEEKLLIPRATAALGGARPPIADLLHIDHGAIAALLVPPPTKEIIETLREILARHDRCEEDAGGLYDACDRALDPEAALQLVAELKAYPPVSVKPYNDGPRVVEHMWRSVERSRAAWREWNAPVGD